MTRFDEMKSAARDGLKRRRERDRNAREFIRTLLEGFASYCGIPNGRMAYFRWDEKAEAGNTIFDENQVLANVVEFDDERDRLSVGIDIMFSSPGVSPEIYATFGLFIAEKEGEFSVAVGPDSPRIVDLTVQTQREDFYGTLVQKIADVFKKDTRSEARKIGFGIAWSAS